MTNLKGFVFFYVGISGRMILDLLFPRICVSCGKKGDYLCTECKKELFSHPEICPFCHQKSSDFQTCKECSKSQLLKGIVIGFAYRSTIKKIILKAKFAHKKDVIRFLAERLSLNIQTNKILNNLVENNQIYISYIPSHRRRHYFEKGYNQSYILSKNLAKILNLPIYKLASKKNYTISQLHLNRNQRQKNLNGVFVAGNLSKIPQNSTILLVDDVTTTGSTLNEVAKTIHNKRPDLNFRGAVICRNMG